MVHATRWSSRTSFIFAASAAAIGLGNVWRFPYLVGQNGGSAFMLIYLLCVILLGVPLLIAEITIGRLGRKNPVDSLRDLAKKSKRSTHWGWLGLLTLLCALLIISYYVVIVGWVLDYTFRAVLGNFQHISEAVSLHNFKQLQTSHWQMLLTDTVTVVGAVLIILLGVKRGLERAVMIIFPLLLVLMLLLLVFSLTSSGAAQGIHFLFHPDFSHITAKTVLLALGQAFFSLNIAMGVTIMFSAFLPENVSVIEGAIGVAIADTGFALLSGLIIFPIVFTYKLPVTAGPSLIFQTLPLAFGHMAGGRVVASLFFIMLFLAAFSSIISLLEPAVRWLMEKHHFKRGTAVLLIGIIIWVLSLLSIGSFSHPQHFNILGHSMFSLLDFLTASIMLPLGGILIAIFTGWLLADSIIHQQLNWNIKSFGYRLWKFLLRYVCPLAILFILLASFGII